MKRHNRLRQGNKAITGLIALIFISACAPKTVPQKQDDIAPASGWIETVAIVSDLERATAFFTDIAGYEVMHSGALAPPVLRLWGLAADATGSEVLMREPGASRGFVRLVRLENAGPQIEARSAGTFLDTGGIMGLNVRVFDIEKTFVNMQRAGWRPLSDPVHFSVENFSVSEAVFMGPDGLVIGLIERKKPALGDAWTMTPGQLSRPNNCFVITSDMPRATAFFQDEMDWNIFLTDKGKAAKAGMNLYGWPHNLVETAGRDVAWFHPEKDVPAREGSIALIRLTGVDGRDFSKTSRPPNLGWTALRTWATADRTDKKGFILAPYGCVSITAQKTPDGVLIENIVPSGNCDN